MSDLFFIKLIASLIERETLLSCLPEDDMTKLIRIRHEDNLNINTIDLKKKSEIDRLIKKFGTLSVLRRLTILREDVLALTKKCNSGSTRSDLELLFIAIESFYDKIEEILAPNIYFKVYCAFFSIKDGYYDRDAFLNSLTKEDIPIDYLLGLEEKVSIQDSLFGNDVETENELTPLIGSYWAKEKIKKAVTTHIIKACSSEEVLEYSKILIEEIKRSENIDHQIILRSVRKVLLHLRSQPRKAPSRQDVAQIRLDFPKSQI